MLLAILAPVFAKILGHGPNQQFIDIGENANGGPVPPSGTFWLGTDNNGRDLFIRILYGARISLIVGVLATGISVVLGVVLGLAAGYIGGFVDTVIARLIDVMLSIPFLILAISIAYISGREPLAGHRHCRRAQLHLSGPHRPGPGDLDKRQGVHRGGQGAGRAPVADHVRRHAAERDGPGHRVRHAADPAAIVAEASLSFLGVGVPPPTADWGSMISDASGFFQYGYWWFLLFPSPGPADHHAGLQHLR